MEDNNSRCLVVTCLPCKTPYTCSCCGWKNNNLKLNNREFICEECGLMIDRDENAAINIENEGKRILIGQRLPELTPVDYPLMDDPTSNGLLRSNDRLKQEERLCTSLCKFF